MSKETGPEIESGYAGPGFGYIDDPKVAEAKCRIAEQGLVQPDASVVAAHPELSGEEPLNPSWKQSIDDLRALKVDDEYGNIERE